MEISGRAGKKGKVNERSFELTNWNSFPFPLQHTQQLAFSQLSNVVSLGRGEKRKNLSNKLLFPTSATLTESEILFLSLRALD